MAMIELRKEVETAALAELNRANAKFPLFASTHEGYAVTLEEVEEAQEAMDNVKSSMGVLWDRVRGREIAPFLEKETSPTAIYNQAIDAACEMVQVAAMLLKYEMSQAEAGHQAMDNSGMETGKVDSMAVYAVDFDDTLAITRFPEIIEAKPKIVAAVKLLKAQGHKVILWTSRAGKDLEAAVEWCKAQGIVFDAINAPLPEQTAMWGNDTRKIYADFYIDDKAMRVEELEVIMDQIVDIVDKYKVSQ